MEAEPVAQLHDTYYVVFHTFSLTNLLFVLTAYLIGSIPFGLILCKLFGYGDVRHIGSGNIGTTNVLRTGSKALAALTLFCDVAKAVLPLGLLYMVLPHRDLAPFLLYPGFFIIFGHCFPVWLKFKGGKGFATTLGTLLVAVPYAGLAAIGGWLLTAFLTRLSSLAALVATAIAPIVTFFIYGQTPALMCFIITALIWLRHKDNIKRLLKGEESRIQFNKET